MSNEKLHNNSDNDVKNPENPVEIILEAVPENKKEEVKEAIMVIVVKHIQGQYHLLELLLNMNKYNLVQRIGY